MKKIVCGEEKRFIYQMDLRSEGKQTQSRSRMYKGKSSDRPEKKDKCAICGCVLHRTKDTYGRPTIQGRSHASKHHYVPERFFGRSKNRRGTQREKIFESCPWGHESEATLFCYDCHEELLHNPVLLPEDIYLFSSIVQNKGLAEHEKTASREKLGRRIMLFREIIRRGLEEVAQGNSQSGSRG